jgi:copper ion binding protein
MPESNLQNDPALATHEMRIEGMTCDHCVRRAEKAIRGVTGVTKVDVNRQEAKASVTFDSRQTDVAAIHDAVRKSGYKPSTLAR